MKKFEKTNIPKNHGCYKQQKHNATNQKNLQLKNTKPANVKNEDSDKRRDLSKFLK